MAKVTVQDLMAAGVHFGHQTKRWNPKMSDYVYGVKSGIYIIDLGKTMHQIAAACNFLQHTVADGGTILFVGTKRQAQEVVKEAALDTGSYFVTERWLGGTLTNNKTIQQSVSKMHELDKLLDDNSGEGAAMKKKELSSCTRKANKLHRNLDGIWNMKRLPAALVVVDACHENIAVAEASKLGIPIVGIIDTNANPDRISYPIVANDDAVKSISVIMGVLKDAVKVASEIYLKRAAEEKARKEEEKARRDEEKAREREAKAKEQKEKKPVAEKGKEGGGKSSSTKSRSKAPKVKDAAPATAEKGEKVGKKPAKGAADKKAAQKEVVVEPVESKEKE
ncbi:MAG: 30S ribosomal protein S2 [Victivallales bacterium]|nr:30S ribosomal protein S2 [Victivallales bacterium]